MQYRSIFAYASRLRALGNDVIVAGLRQRGVVGIVPSHGDIIHVLLRQESCSMTELAQRIGRTKSTVTVLVRKLEQGGYVRRMPDSTDARGVRVSLTEQGKALESAVQEISDQLESCIRTRLTDAEALQLEALLAKCVAGTPLSEEQTEADDREGLLQQPEPEGPSRF